MEIRGNIKNIIYMFGGEVLIKAVFFIANAILARFLGVSTYGEFSNIFSITATISFLADFGSSTVVTRDIASGKRSPEEVLKVYTKAKLEISLLVLFLFAIIGFSFDRSNMHLYLLLGIYNIIQNGVLLFYYAILRGKKAFKEESLSKLINLSGMIVGFGIFIFFQNMVAASLMYLLSALFPLFYLYKYLNKKYSLKFEDLWNKVQSIRSFHLHWKIGVGNFFEGLTQIIPIIAINYLSGAYSLGLFSAAYRLITPFLLLNTIANYFLMPYIAENYGKISLSKKKILAGILLIVSYIGISYLVSEPLIKVIYGLDYIGALHLFRILILLPIFDIFALVQMTQLASREREKTYLFSSIANVFITVLMIFIAISLIEETALAVTIAVVANRFIAILLRIILNKIYDNKYEKNNL
ncbi:oligosaccharide flippase family protein [Candidatus Dojkabacteria bacterium]|nr:oligosaccharide flippase family protein [Candidatus Dojkabacteria bacterium]